MIAEIFPEFYDIRGRKSFRPGGSQRRAGFRPTFPIGRNFTQPLKFQARDLAEMRKFLVSCRYSKRRAEAETDYWQPPEEFEQTRTGDCVDFALWVWRQVVGMGYEARFVGGRAGKYGAGHAWVTFEKDGRSYLLEPQLRFVGLRMPRVSTLRYHPLTSVTWNGRKASFYQHEERRSDPPLSLVPALVGEWLQIWFRFWRRTLPLIVVGLVRRVFLGKLRERLSLET